MSANYYTGYSADKPSSKVLNPPGGRSNNIFGSVEENNTSSNCNKAKNQQSSIFFGDDSTGVQKPQQHQQNNNRMKSTIFEDENVKENNSKSKRTGYNTITGKLYDDEPQDSVGNMERKEAEAQHDHQVQQRQHQQHHYPNHQHHQTHQSNFIEQKPYEEEKKVDPSKPQLHTSSRVLQPPGGKSHGLW